MKAFDTGSTYTRKKEALRLTCVQLGKTVTDSCYCNLKLRDKPIDGAILLK
jgi:hypothetical protein